MKDLYNHAVSFSGLGLLLEGPAAYKRYIEKPENADTSYFRKGGMVDCFLTEPTEFDKRYAIMKGTIPSGMMGDLIRVYSQLLDLDNGDTEDECFEAAYSVSGYKLPLTTVKKKFQSPENQYYFNFLRDSKGKTVVSKEESDQAAVVAFALKTDPYTEEYLGSNHIDNPLIETFDQVKLEWEGYKGYTIKGIVDRIIINHSKKTVTPIDIKTTSSSILEFRKSYLKYGYFRQGAIYTDGIKQSIELLPEGYTLENFRFIVADMAMRLPPAVFEMSCDDIDVGRRGGNWLGTDRPVKGYQCLIDELEFYQKSQQWTHPCDYNDGAILLNNFELT